jgi:chloride channel protein, CIC family
MSRSDRFSLDILRRQLAGRDALPQLALLAVVAGLLTGAVIIAFRAAIESTLAATLPGGDSENFEGLSRPLQFLLPIAGGLLVGLMLHQLRPSERRVGVVHVMERLSRHQGHLPMRNAAAQFFGGIVALVCGQSGGREGPAIHVGAATSSLLGQRFQLPNNSIRTLVACGTAAAIAGSFNTPIAGVIFAMEVVMGDYRMRSFIPVIIASVTATLMTRYVYGSEPAFTTPPLGTESLLDIPFIAAAGVIIGAFAALFIGMVRMFASQSARPIWLRGIAAGAITGTCAMAAPAVLGIGYDTVNAAMLNQLTLTVLIVIVVMKMVASAACVGLGMPVGVIGPTLVIGAALGGALGAGAGLLLPEAAEPALYVILGMAAMMAAVLQAPLAALMAVLELTANPYVILPAMLIIVAATMTCSEIFRQRSVFAVQLSVLGLAYPPGPVTQHLQSVGVASLMRRDFAVLPEAVAAGRARALAASRPRWILVESDDGRYGALLNAHDLERFIDERFPSDDDAVIDLNALPALRMDIARIGMQATLDAALARLDQTGVEALWVAAATSGRTAGPAVGIVTRRDIEDHIRFAG